MATSNANALRDRLLKNSKIDHTSVLVDSVIFNRTDAVTTAVPMINAALSGDVNGGLLPGFLMIAGPSKHFKTAFGLVMVRAFLDKYEDGVVLFYDSEFGTPASYVSSFGIDSQRIVHTPVTNVEELKFDIMAQLAEIKRGDHVMIFIDSIGNLASKKEVEDAIAEKSVADMSRAKQLKSLFRMVTPHLTLKAIPLVGVNHTYKEIAMYPRDIVSGGTGAVYSANDIWIVGRQQDKDGKELNGFNFVINIEKSRTVREKSKIFINVDFTDGMQKWSGLFDLAIEAGIVTKPAQGWYQLLGEGQKYRRDDIEFDDAFWKAVLTTTGLQDYVRNKYQLATHSVTQNLGATEAYEVSYDESISEEA